MAPLDKLRHLSVRLSSADSAGAVLFFLIALVYLPGTCTHPQWDDSVEFVLISHNWSIAHPSGYPLYSIIINLLDTLLSLPSSWSISLFSAASAAGAIVVWHLIMIRMGVSRVLAFVCALVLAQGGAMYSQAVIQEVYTFNAFLQMLTLHRMVVFTASRRRRDLYLTAFFLGLSFSHHLTAFWLLPPLAYLLWPHYKKFDQPRSELLRSAAALLLGLSFYLYLPIRSAMQPFWDQGDPETLRNFLAHVSGEVYRYRLFSLGPSEIWAQAKDWFLSLWEQWGLLFLLFAIPGMLRAAMLEKRFFITAMLWLFTALVYCFNYNIPDKEGYYLLPHMLVGTFALSGIAVTLKRLSALLPEKTVDILALPILVLPLLGLLFMEDSGHIRNTSLQDLTYDLWGEVPSESLLFTEDLNIHYSTTLLQVEKQLSSDRAVVATYLLSFKWYIDFLRKRWPEISWPASIEHEIDNIESLLRKSPARRAGDIRQQGIERIVTLIASANVDHHRLFAFIHEPGGESTRKYGFNLQKWGLVYRMNPGEPEYDHLWRCDYSPSYMVGKRNLADERKQHVASLYATSCNRLGIKLSELRQPQEAADVIRKSLRYDPDYLPAMKNLGAVLVQQLNQFGEGREVWNNYVAAARKAGEEPDPRVVEWLRKNK